MLFGELPLKEGEEDFTIMRIVIEGIENGEPKKYTYNLLDKFNRETKTISMARTGYTCTAVANLMLDGGFKNEGVSAPEIVGIGEGNLTYVLKYLAERGVHYRIS
ncbi:MAG: hypothetical protein L3J11_09550 [Draconibacterium sp.]|nr:hypothetical protein [Draconibacterium sp.]